MRPEDACTVHENPPSGKGRAQKRQKGMSSSLWAPIHHRKKCSAYSLIMLILYPPPVPFPLSPPLRFLYLFLSFCQLEDLDTYRMRSTILDIPLSRSSSCDLRPSNYLVFDMKHKCESNLCGDTLRLAAVAGCCCCSLIIRCLMRASVYIRSVKEFFTSEVVPRGSPEVRYLS